MNERHKSLIAQLQEKHAANQTLLAKGADITADDVAAIEKNTAEMEGWRSEIKRFQDVEALAAKNADINAFLNQPAATVPHTATGMKDLGTTPAGDTILDAKGNVLFHDGAGLFGAKTWQALQSTDYKEAYGRYLRKGIHGLSGPQVKSLEEGLDEQGGYLVPADLLAVILQRKPTVTRIADRVTNVNTSRDAITMPKVNYAADDIYTTGFRSTWTGERPASDTAHRVSDTDLFGQIRIPVYTNMISGIMTNDMVEDSAFDVLGWIADKFRETIMLLRGNMTLNGTGIGQPTGMLVSPGTAGRIGVVPSGHASQLTADGLLDLAYSVPEQYEDNIQYILNKTSTGKAIRKLKDSEGRYLWGAGLQDSGLATARPSNLAGYDYSFEGFMPNVAANAYPVVCGDPRGYTLVNRIGLSIQILREKYAEENQLGVLGRVRFGGDVTEPWRLKAQKVSES